MGKFKLSSPYSIDNIPRYEVPFTPDNIGDESGLVAKANKNGTMIVNKNIPKDSKLRKEAESHEDHHLKDMMQGKLDYDDEAVYHNLDGKGVKKVSRKNFDESNKNLPWEKQAYKAGENMEEKDMRPNPNKLDGPPSMKDETPLSFQKIGSRHKFGRTGDKSKVSMNENFGPSMVKKFYGMSMSGVVDGATDASGTSEQEKKAAEADKQFKENYKGRQIRYDVASNRVYGTAGEGAQTGTGDIYEIKEGKFPGDVYYQGDLRADMKKGDNKTNYDQQLGIDIRNLQKARKKFDKDFKPMSLPGATFSGEGQVKGTTVKYIRTPDSPDFDPNLTTKENMMLQKFVTERYDQDGTLIGGNKAMTFGDMNSVAKGRISADRTRQREDAFRESDALNKFYSKYPTISKR